MIIGLLWADAGPGGLDERHEMSLLRKQDGGES